LRSNDELITFYIIKYLALTYLLSLASSCPGVKCIAQGVENFGRDDES
jgi:hypothetical protein